MAIRDDLRDLPGAAIPTFSAPETGWNDPLPDEDRTPEDNQPAQEPEPEKPSLLARLGLTGSKPATPDGDTRTGTSSRGGDKVGAREAAVAVAGLLSVAAFGAAWVVQRKTRGTHTLRQPTDQQADDIAAPLARIACRFVPAELLSGVVADGIKSMSAFGAYATDGPLIIPNTVTRKDTATDGE